MSQSWPMVYLVRHAETAWTLTGQHTGRTDLPLTEQGELHARELRSRLAELRFDRVFSSPLQRARRTAELAMPAPMIVDDADLMEWHYGMYEGRRTVDIQADRPGWSLFRDGCPGGETLEAVAARADRVIAGIRARGDTVVLVAHREILRLIVVRWIGLAAIEGRRLLLATTSLSRLGYDHDLTEPVIHALNETRHNVTASTP